MSVEMNFHGNVYGVRGNDSSNSIALQEALELTDALIREVSEDPTLLEKAVAIKIKIKEVIKRSSES